MHVRYALLLHRCTSPRLPVSPINQQQPAILDGGRLPRARRGDQGLCERERESWGRVGMVGCGSVGEGVAARAIAPHLPSSNHPINRRHNTSTTTYQRRFFSKRCCGSGTPKSPWTFTRACSVRRSGWDEDEDGMRMREDDTR